MQREKLCISSMACGLRGFFDVNIPAETNAGAMEMAK